LKHRCGVGLEKSDSAYIYNLSHTTATFKKHAAVGNENDFWFWKVD